MQTLEGFNFEGSSDFWREVRSGTARLVELSTM